MSNLKHISTLAETQGHGAEDLLHVAERDDRKTSPLELELAEMIVATLNLEVAAVDIDPNAPLYREGLGLDSIDVLELALAISKKYGLNLRSDDENNLTIFSSLRSLNTHIQQHRSK
jgi:acyl carrier protein